MSTSGLRADDLSALEPTSEPLHERLRHADIDELKERRIDAEGGAEIIRACVQRLRIWKELNQRHNKFDAADQNKPKASRDTDLNNAPVLAVGPFDRGPSDVE
jgi:hypothetical protein